MGVLYVDEAIPHIEGEGMHVRRAIPNRHQRMIDPFLLLDHMGPRSFAPGEGKGAPDHPHRGFETVTYVLEGRLQHKDSVGNEGDLGPGDVQWMTAGSGVVHSEMPHPDLQRTGGTVHGLQLWVNLPAKDKMIPPRYQDIPSGSIPEVDVGSGKVRVIAGRFQDAEAMIDTRTPISYLHAELGSGGEVALPVPDGHHGFLYVIAGAGTIDGKTVQEAAVAAVEGPMVDVASDEGLSAILVTGKPIGEPVFQWGPFVMNSRDEIVQAVEDFQSGRMGQIQNSGLTVIYGSKDEIAGMAGEGFEAYHETERAAAAIRRHPGKLIIAPSVSEPLRGQLKQLAASSGVAVEEPETLAESAGE